MKGKRVIRRRMKAFVLTVFFFLLSVCNVIMAEAEENSDEITASELYARSAVLMDADSGRILFAKNGEEKLAMASTTKIMTCILALENGSMSDQVSVSSNAASQPAVRLGMREGQKFFLEDLLYSLMLESHNDSAVAVAEHIGGSVEGFASMMNQKAMELECTDTYFITPNGLDAEDETGFHHTTAENLARIMRYCIMESGKREDFLKITQTQEHDFSDCEGNGSYQCRNHNLFLQMMEGALSGKTGFTADAGYCYVGALQKDERTFIVALLACGWPNNKGYKWSDTRKLMEYGLDNYEYRQIDISMDTGSVLVENGAAGRFPGTEAAELKVEVNAEPFRVLLRRDEDVNVFCDLPEKIQAPVERGQKIGTMTCSLDGIELKTYPLTAAKSMEERTFQLCLCYIRDAFFNVSDII